PTMFSRNLALNEVMRIFPFTLRITDYSRAPASWPGRPKIHLRRRINGEADPDLRRMHGMVQMTASGEVFYPEDRQSRWASDGVHIDGLCSAVGIIGM
ncbi:hypothetical protein BJV77DRAFT_932228, partial [Russula vinacea]